MCCGTCCYSLVVCQRGGEGALHSAAFSSSVNFAGVACCVLFRALWHVSGIIIQPCWNGRVYEMIVWRLVRLCGMLLSCHRARCPCINDFRHGLQAASAGVCTCVPSLQACVSCLELHGRALNVTKRFSVTVPTGPHQGVEAELFSRGRVVLLLLSTIVSWLEMIRLWRLLCSQVTLVPQRQNPQNLLRPRISWLDWYSLAVVGPHEPCLAPLWVGLWPYFGI
ncbi:hypothetical protein COO60DRAFT_1039155 [Scenedesmus sp. NREL 46B-D3]|nr:hypothetical protein COO60DRAFT_1039155 [Scenedesmus sp. NREL 46B-D3]